MADLISCRTTLNASMAFSWGACGAVRVITSEVAGTEESESDFF